MKRCFKCNRDLPRDELQNRIRKLETALNEYRQDARAARRERDEATRERDEMDSAAHKRAGRYATEKSRAVCALAEARAEIEKMRPVVEAADEITLQHDKDLYLRNMGRSTPEGRESCCSCSLCKAVCAYKAES